MASQVKIRELWFDKIRSFVAPASLKLSQNINIITGVNGAGKSTVLEALRYALSGRIDQCQVTRNAGTPCVVAAELLLSDGSRVAQRDHATLTAARATLRKQTREVALQLPVGVVDYLLICAVDDMYWMFGKPADIYATANEIFSLEKLSKFAQEMGTQGNSLGKRESGLKAVLETHKQLKQTKTQAEAGKNGAQLCNGIVTVLKACMQSFEHILELGDIREIPGDEEPTIDCGALQDDRHELAERVEKGEIERATLASTRGANPGIVFDKEQFEKALREIEEYYPACVIEDEHISALILRYHEEKELENKADVSEAIEQAFRAGARNFESELEHINKEKHETFIKEAEIEEKLERIRTQLEHADDAERLDRELEKLEDQAKEHAMRDKFIEEQLQALKLSEATISRELAALSAARENIEQYAHESQIFCGRIAELQGEIGSDLALVGKAFGAEGLTKKRLESIINVKIASFAEELRKYSFQSVSAYFIEAKQILCRALPDLEAVSRESQNMLMSRSLSDEFELLSSELLVFATEKQLAEDFMDELSTLLTDYTNELTLLAKNDARSTELRTLMQFADFLKRMRAVFCFENDEEFEDVLERYLQATRRVLDYQVLLTNAPMLNENERSTLTEASLCCQALESTIQIITERDNQLSQALAGAFEHDLHVFSFELPPELTLAISEREEKLKSAKIELLAADEQKQTLKAEIKQLENAFAEVRTGKKAFKLDFPVEQARTHACALEDEVRKCEAQLAALDARAEATSKQLHVLRSSGIAEHANAGQAAILAWKMQNEAEYNECSAEIQEVEAQLQRDRRELSNIESKIELAQSAIRRAEERQEQRRKAEQLEMLGDDVRSKLESVATQVDAVFQLHEQIERAVAFKLKAEVSSAFKALEAFAPPFSAHFERFQAVYDYFIQTHEAFAQLAMQEQQLKKITQELRESVHQYSENAVALRLSCEYTLASSNLKKAIKDFEDSIFQQADAFFSQFWEEVYMRRDIENVRIYRDKNKSTLELQGLIRFEWRPLKSFVSAGEEALCSILFRMALIRALRLPLALFCSDEPTNFLDEGNEEELARTLARFGAQSGLQFIIVTHSERFADRIKSESGGEARTIRIINGDGGSAIGVDRI